MLNNVVYIYIYMGILCIYGTMNHDIYPYIIVYIYIYTVNMCVCVHTDKQTHSKDIPYISNLNMLELLLGKKLDDQDLSIWTLTFSVVLQGQGCPSHLGWLGHQYRRHVSMAAEVKSAVNGKRLWCCPLTLTGVFLTYAILCLCVRMRSGNMEIPEMLEK